MAAFAASFLSCASSPRYLSSSYSLPLRPNYSVSFPILRFGKVSKDFINVKTLVFASSDGIRAHEGEGDSRSKLALASKDFILDLRTKRQGHKQGYLNTRELVSVFRLAKSLDFNHLDRVKSVLLKLIQEIEPLDVSIIQRDVPPTTVDAMKRTISGMLGLLPSDQFQVLIEALWKPLSKLLVSSLMTGYTLWNAEYRLCLERNFDTDEESTDKQPIGDSKYEALRTSLLNNIITNKSGQDELHKSEKISENASEIPDLGQMTPEMQQYILKLQSRLFSVKKELHEVKRKNAALQMQQFVGEEKNELLDYLRSLQPEMVAELSEPTSADLKETIHSVVHGLLATLSPKMHSQAPHSTSIGSASSGIGNDIVDNTSIQFQPLISLSRDYLARLLFWCMLLGHYLRGLEYRVELMEVLSLEGSDEHVH